jgi:hypothetical protein
MGLAGIALGLLATGVVDALRKDAMQRKAVNMLNELLEIDQPAVQFLVDHRVPCDLNVQWALSDIVYGMRNNYPTIGPLGLLNGMIGPEYMIRAVYETRADGTLGRVQRFEAHRK